MPGSLHLLLCLYRMFLHRHLHSTLPHLLQTFSQLSTHQVAFPGCSTSCHLTYWYLLIPLLHVTHYHHYTFYSTYPDLPLFYIHLFIHSYHPQWVPSSPFFFPLWNLSLLREEIFVLFNILSLEFSWEYTLFFSEILFCLQNSQIALGPVLFVYFSLLLSCCNFP